MLIENLFNLDNAIKWIERVVLNCCSIDYVSPRHLNNEVDSVIRFGKCCISDLPKGIIEYPVLLMFENEFLNDKSTEFIKNQLDTIQLDDTLLIVDTNYLIPTLELIKFKSNLSIAKFIKFTNKWTIEKVENHFIELTENLKEKKFYNYLIDKKLNEFKCILFIGDQIPNSIKILSLLKVIHLNPTNQISNEIKTHKELIKRCSLIEKVKKLNKFGIVFSHSYPDINPYLNSLNRLAIKKQKKLNYITLVQTTDQFKLGNFSTLESLVLINNCYCSYLIDTIDLHIPLINYTEFMISCGEKVEYGQAKWNDELESDLEEENSNDLKNDEISNQLLLDDRNTALVENYLKEDKWFGLKVNAGNDEISNLKVGLKGLAMGYDNENNDN